LILRNGRPLGREAQSLGGAGGVGAEPLGGHITRPEKVAPDPGKALSDAHSGL
jgi:hypothetical protein